MVPPWPGECEKLDAVAGIPHGSMPVSVDDSTEAFDRALECLLWAQSDEQSLSNDGDHGRQRPLWADTVDSAEENFVRGSDAAEPDDFDIWYEIYDKAVDTERVGLKCHGRLMQRLVDTGGSETNLSTPMAAMWTVAYTNSSIKKFQSTNH